MKVQVERVLYDSPDTGFHICKAAVLEATQEVFENSPEQLLTVKGIGRQRLQKIIDSYKDSRSIQEIVSYLAPLGVTANKCAKIAKAFGGEAMNVLLNEPFRLCEIEGFGFLIVDQIARKTTFSLTDHMRICGAIRYVLQAAITPRQPFIPL